MCMYNSFRKSDLERISYRHTATAAVFMQPGEAISAKVVGNVITESVR